MRLRSRFVRILCSSSRISSYVYAFQELFNTTVGALREITLHYDASGRSKGVASITFQKKGDGARAFAQYNNRLIDGS